MTTAPILLRRLEIHASHACNLTCESCSHFSDHGLTGIVSPDEAASWMAPWSSRLRPKYFAVLGGEPTINPKLTEVVAVAARSFPHSIVEVVTNGFFLHKHPGLGEVLRSAARSRLVVSEHWHSPEYRESFEAGLAMVKAWGQWEGFELVVRRYDGSQKNLTWTRRHLGYGPAMMPYQDGDRRSSWQSCPAKTCMQILNGKLWKCPMVAYLPMMKEKFADLDSSWNPGLAYVPLSPGASDKDLAAFVAREDEEICGLCPSGKRPFKPRSPLVPARDLLRVASGRQAH